MSTLWTPYGERPVPDPTDRPSGPPGPTAGVGPAQAQGAPAGGPAADRAGATTDVDEMRQALEALLRVPVAQVVAELAMQLRELALVHLAGGRPGSTEAARLAIDAMAALTEGLGDRLAPHHDPLAAALAEVRLAFVEAVGAGRAGASAASAPTADPDGA